MGLKEHPWTNGEIYESDQLMSVMRNLHMTAFENRANDEKAMYKLRNSEINLKYRNGISLRPPIIPKKSWPKMISPFLTFILNEDEPSVINCTLGLVKYILKHEDVRVAA